MDGSWARSLICNAVGGWRGGGGGQWEVSVEEVGGCKVRRRGGDAAGGKAALFKRAINQPFQKQQRDFKFHPEGREFPSTLTLQTHTAEGDLHIHTADLFIETKQGPTSTRSW